MHKNDYTDIFYKLITLLFKVANTFSDAKLNLFDFTRAKIMSIDLRSKQTYRHLNVVKFVVKNKIAILTYPTIYGFHKLSRCVVGAPGIVFRHNT